VNTICKSFRERLKTERVHERASAMGARKLWRSLLGVIWRARWSSVSQLLSSVTWSWLGCPLPGCVFVSV